MPRRERVIDFQKSNLHVVNYSVPVATADGAGRIERAPVHATGASGLDSLPDVLLQGELGILPATETARGLKDEEYEVCIDFNAGRRPI